MADVTDYRGSSWLSVSSVSVSCTAGCHSVNIERHPLFYSPLSQMWRSNFVRLNPFAARFHRSIAQQSGGIAPSCRSSFSLITGAKRMQTWTQHQGFSDSPHARRE